MTPYAILLVKPTDSDEVIRKTYHVFARQTHPDKHVQDPEWYVYTTAYTAIKTADAREAWERQQAMLSGRCADCEGAGVRGTRMFKGKIRLCTTCKGMGRL